MAVNAASVYAQQKKSLTILRKTCSDRQASFAQRALAFLTLLDLVLQLEEPKRRAMS
ncbi:hypothetical protein VCR4J2_40161 [Vibrio coralliirubri]|nr:hypothetical protein VCR4J2_40161 [Vibrio coralliirubri]